jgi:hypothetical protein
VTPGSCKLTPPGSPASIIFGTGVSSAEPGSAEGLHLVVEDIEAARTEFLGRGVEVSEVFHDAGGVFHHAGNKGRVLGPDPQRRSYASFVSFADPSDRYRGVPRVFCPRDGRGSLTSQSLNRFIGRKPGSRQSRPLFAQ